MERKHRGREADALLGIFARSESARQRIPVLRQLGEPSRRVM